MKFTFRNARLTFQMILMTVHRYRRYILTSAVISLVLMTIQGTFDFIFLPERPVVSIKESELKPYKVTNKTILILSLMHNSEKYIEQFEHLVTSLTYPHHLLSLAIGEEGSGDETVPKVQEMLERVKLKFNSVRFFKLSELKKSTPVRQKKGNVPKHELQVQYVRRRHIALARNLLLHNALGDEDYVMWLDSDIEVTPRDVIQRLLRADKDIVVPNCRILVGGLNGTYDWNTWRETALSLRYWKRYKPDYVFYEGYHQGRPNRLHLDELMAHGDLVEVDGVGGCLILLRATHHRQGLHFPSYNFQNQIETEGFSRMAQAMGLKLWLMSNVQIFHVCNKDTFGLDCMKQKRDEVFPFYREMLAPSKTEIRNQSL